MKMRPRRKLRRKRLAEAKALQDRKCWCCQRCPIGEVDGEAVLVVSYADGSYSGAFHVPLCNACLTDPHQGSMRRLAMANPTRFISDCLSESDLNT